MTAPLWSMAVFAFGVVTFLAGAFTTYFGKGRSRGIGVGLVVVGVVVVALFAWFANLVALGPVPPVVWSSTMAVDAILAVVGALIGGAVAVGLFLASIMNA